MYDEMIKREYIGKGDCIRHYEMVRELWKAGNIRKSTWESFCMCCLGAIIEDGGEKIVNELKKVAKYLD